MNWISIPTSIMRDRRYLFLETVERAAWFERIVHCLENDLEAEIFCLPFGPEIYKESLRTSHYEGTGNHKTRRYRRMLAARAIATHTEEEWLALVAEYGGRCLRCGALGKVTRDHVIPVTKGGSDGIDNIQPLCHSCNSSKHNKIADYRREHHGLD